MTTESRRPANLSRYGKAGLRARIDEMLESHHGRPREEWAALGRPGLQVLHLIASGSEPHHFRNRAIGAVGLIADPSSVAVLGQVAQDRREDVVVRVASTLSLAEIGGRAAAVLDRLLKEDETLVRHRAAEALGKIGDQKALPALRQVAASDEAPLVQEAASNAVERIELLRDLRAAGRGGKGRRS